MVLAICPGKQLRASHIITLYTLNLHHVVFQLHLKKTKTNKL